MKEISVNIPIPTTWMDSQADRDIIQSALKFFEDGTDGGMTHFQITNFVLSDKEFPTIGSKYFQARREIYVRYENLVNQHFEFQKVEANAEIKQCELEDLQANAYQSSLLQAKAKLARVERDQLLMRLEFIKKEAKRQIRELKAFWDNHQYYGKMITPGVTRELTEGEHWITKAKQGDQTLAEWEKTKVGDKPQTITSDALDGPFAHMRQEIVEAHMKDDILKVTAAMEQAKLAATPPMSQNGHKEG